MYVEQQAIICMVDQNCIHESIKGILDWADTWCYQFRMSAIWERKT